MVFYFQKLSCILESLSWLWAGSPITLSRELLHDGSIRFSWLTWKLNQDCPLAGVFQRFQRGPFFSLSVPLDVLGPHFPRESRQWLSGAFFCSGPLA
jgi:hypothetical protein